ncbi:hypothetical protein [Paradevosia shaoguanensis]|jgi:hypothetical protein|uniref:EF-hand domain-containing protein n=1 Tax=Paradevosia shaoguanensis TaxID=1335043 RepID=A0AA41UC56_9HYPH|nr:hypothetical protein [Paradevosia shaoguanensis]KFL27387.1 hypothetical protein JP74_07285 [Devosia sp. 17-2-E-8]MCF1743404.1 hypothetical protein [Paradevosia shaoguanensis]MCI0127887.1 hypothetical protein [Paradevosia shaoguanensis]CDP50864.1 hypothetical protein [Devosia sp. DBB001]
MKSLLKISAALLIAAVPVTAFAAAPALDYAKIDTAKSGKITEAQLKAVYPKLTDDQFKKADADHDGTLSKTEFDAWMKTLA